MEMDGANEEPKNQQDTSKMLGRTTQQALHHRTTAHGLAVPLNENRNVWVSEAISGIPDKENNHQRGEAEFHRSRANDLAASNECLGVGPAPKKVGVVSSHDTADAHTEAPRSKEPLTVSYADFHRLEKKYNKLLHEHKKVKHAFEKGQRQGLVYKEYGDKAMLRVQEAKFKIARLKASCVGWNDFVDRLVGLAVEQKSQKVNHIGDLLDTPVTTPNRPDRSRFEKSTSRQKSPLPRTLYASSPPLSRHSLHRSNAVESDLVFDNVPHEIMDLPQDKPGADVDTRQCLENVTAFVESLRSPGRSLPQHRASLEIADSEAARAADKGGEEHAEPHPGVLDHSEQQPQLVEDPEKQVSSQTTDCEPVPTTSTARTPIYRESEDDDVPEVVSFRTLKRKRIPMLRYSINRDELRNGTMQGSIRVKHEDSHSSPLRAAAMVSPHDESLDLDEIPGYVETPRKRQLRRMLSNASLYYEQLRHTRARSEPLDLDSMPHHLSESFEMEIGQHSGEANVNEEEADEYDKADEIKGEAERSDPMILALPPRRVLPGQAPVNRHSGSSVAHPLHRLSPNTRILPSTSETRSRPKARSRRRPHPLGELSEDGDTYGKARGRETPQDEAPVGDPLGQARSVGGRIRNLLENPTPGKQPLNTLQSPLHTPTTQPLLHRTAVALFSKTPVPSLQAPAFHSVSKLPATTTPSHPQPLALHSIPKRPATTPQTAIRTQRHLLHPPDTRPEEEPLRARPRNRLNLDDFKINPAANHGYDFAFNEVVRNLDQRKCLPGCTRPACCGDRFRKMVQAGGALPTPTRGLWDSDSPTEEHAEQRLLEVYLGDNARARLQRLSTAERADLLVEAKAAQLAQKHGRHRHAFQRSTTPPGFWRADFPTTQEVEEDRVAARKLEREKVEERWKEAMRPGGRWLFRDE